LLATAIAVIGGKMISKKISERVLNTCGGILMLIFAFTKIVF
jgi:putative Ca2+/H+ antiporter (TMEM165/GDT1 family)